MTYTTHQILEKLEEVADFVKSEGYNVFYVGLYGSQNYGLDTESSDLDFKAIILPSLDMVIDKTKELSKVYEFAWGQIEVKDIRNYVDSCVKVNVNFLEILSTQYYVTKFPYSANKFRSFFEPLLREQGIIYLRACRGMVMQKFHALRHPFPSKLDVIEKFGYDPKQLCHIVRLSWLMGRYTRGNYSFTHENDEMENLISIKKGIVPDKDVDGMVEKYLRLCESIVNKYTTEPIFKTKNEMVIFSRELIYNSILNKKSIQ